MGRWGGGREDHFTFYTSLISCNSETTEEYNRSLFGESGAGCIDVEYVHRISFLTITKAAAAFHVGFLITARFV